MPSHEPPGYECPFCTLAAGDPVGTGRVTDLVARTDRAMTMIAPRWRPRNPGHALITVYAGRLREAMRRRAQGD